MKTVQTISARLAPYVCAAVLCAFIVMGGISARRPSGTADYRARVKTAIEAIPYRVGPAVGTDSEPTEAAIRLLSPNKILERRYLDPTTGGAFSLLVVHCGDARDMIGHYPPVCYPAHGWKLVGQHPLDIEINSEKACAIRYEFSRMDDLSEHRMSVIDFFVIPADGTAIYSEMNAVEYASRKSDVGGLGIAQVQIVMGEEATSKWSELVVRETLQAIAPAVRVISQGIKK